MHIIDAHLHFVPGEKYFSVSAHRAGHENTEEHLRKTYADLDITCGIVMGNNGLRPEDNEFPGFLRYCVGIEAYELGKEDDSEALDNIEKKIKSRGLFDTFMSEYANFILKRRKYRVRIECSAAQVADVPNHWTRRFRINGMVGFINKLSYNVSAKDGLNSLEVEFYVL